MNNVITELFLNTYFIFDALAGNIIENKQALFNKLYSAFPLPKQDCMKLFEETQGEIVREIKSYKDYAQVCRIQKFSELTGGECICSKEYEMVGIKGNALKKLKQAGLEEYSLSTSALVCKFINDTASMGFIYSLCLLGFLQCEGIFVAKNEKIGKKNLKKAALWNSIEGIILSLAYDNSTRQENLDRLYTITLGTLYENMSDKVNQFYAVNKTNFIPECDLLKSAIETSILKPEFFMPQYARFIFSDVLSFKDKKRVLFSEHKESIAAMTDLPLKLTCCELLFDTVELENLPFMHKQDQDRIKCIVSDSNLRNDPGYHPLCVCCESEYLLMLYAKALEKAFPSSHVKIIDVAELSESDFELSINNIFVRSCDENKQNVIIFYCKDEIKEYALDAIKNFFITNKRKNFRLQYPNAIIDLSAVLPICFCDNQNSRVLKNYCEMITLESVEEKEKIDIISFIMNEKAKKYKVNDLQISKPTQSALISYSIDRIENLLDKFVSYNRGKATVLITSEIFKETCCKTSQNVKYGFGGAENESK